MYKIKVCKKDYLNKPFEAYNLDLKTFTMDVLVLPEIDYKLVINYKKRIFYFAKKHIFFILGFIFFILLLIFNSLSIDSVIFSNIYDENIEIEKYIKNNLHNICGFKILKSDTEEMSRELRGIYDNFEWISIKKNGNDLYVEISKSNYYTLDLNNRMEDIIASKDGIIKDYYIKDGINNVYYNKYVKKGDVLIYSNNNYYTSGIVNAEVCEYKTIRVKKNDCVCKYTSYDEAYQLCILNKKIIFNKNNENCDIILIDSIGFNLLSIDRLGIYKKGCIDVNYKYNDALFLAGKKILSIYDNIKIEENKLLNSYEDNEYYYFNYFIKTIQNICTYRR